MAGDRFSRRRKVVGAVGTFVTGAVLAVFALSGSSDGILKLLSPPGAGYDATSIALTTGSGSPVTVTRASTQTCEVTPGTLTSVASNKPCVESGALRVEPAGTNLLLHSASLDNAAWTKTNATATADATTAPDGTSAADKLSETAINGQHQAMQDATNAGAAALTGSVYLKAAERTWAIVQLKNSDNTADAFAWVNLSTGATGTTSGSPTVSVSDAGNGWWRARITKALTATGSYRFAVYTATGDNVVTYAGTAGSGVYVWGAQLETGSVATSYIPTGAATASRAAQTTTVATPAGLSTTEGAAKVCVTPKGWSTTNPLGADMFLLDGNAALETARFLYIASGTGAVRIWDGTSFATITPGLADGVRQCFRASWSAVRNQMYVEQVGGSRSTVATTSGLGAFDATIGIGAKSTGTKPSLVRIDSICFASNPDGCR